MSDLLSLGASGVRAYQTALATVSENIANSATTGYVRRTATMTAIGGARAGIASNAVMTGSGVVVSGITRSVDELQNAAVRSAGADLAKTETGSTWLTGIQTALTGNDLGDRVTGFYTAATTLASDPTSGTARAAMLEAGTSAAAAFGSTGAALAQVGSDLDTTGAQAAAQLGSLSLALAKVNEGLGRTPAGTSAAADLADQRDSLLDQMSVIADVNVTQDALGRTAVRLGGASGPTLVAGTDAGTVAYARNASGAVGFTVTFRGTASAVSPGGGALAGIADGAQKLADAQNQLDAAATAFSSGVNAVQTGGDDANGTAGTPFFAVGATPTDITVALTDPAGIAAAATGAGPRDASNLAALATERSGDGVEGKVTALVTGTAAALAQRTVVADAQSAIRDGAVGARASGSAVDLDTEAVDLMRFQQAYSASSRVIQVARETFQSILAIN